MAKVTKENFLERLFEKAPEERDTIEIIEYSGMSKSITYKCKICGVQETVSSASNLLKRHTNIICKNCKNPLRMRKQQKELEEKAMKKMTNSKDLIFISLFEKETNNRRRLAIRYQCKECGKISEVFVRDCTEDHFSCRHCSKGVAKTTEDFQLWFMRNYPDFEILELAEYVNNTSRLHIKCKKCGFIFYPSVTSLKRPNKVLCPKCRNDKSRQELYIAEWLIKHKVLFDSEVYFPWLTKRRYDFYIPELNLIIEYDGQQHYCYSEHFHKTKEQFLEYKKTDCLKTTKAIENGLNILRIPYYYGDKINDILNNVFGSTTISQESRGKCLEIDSFLNKEEDIV